ncbi:biotin synthase [Thalassoporum mexicanum PCC 7367]|uniref:biotin synthase BioB n=1 Tax=Thalassoporum mexicanum TaxID=3457544 RepID=UPI00029FE432|nr:biotin synthase BioB [Pseudanabaena sp. PCC 7367]AFY70057.1 biotin synthase [Pseudanabaena sp. PCC 7367]
MISLDFVAQTYHKPLISLVFEAQTIHRQYHQADAVQLCTLANIKSGRCPEDCKYCPQSARYKTEAETYPLLPLAEVITQAQAAKANGSTRFCMGAAWRSLPDGEEFDRIIAMIEAVVDLEMEACVTLGMVRPDQAQRLAQAGLTAYNHNLDTSAQFYPDIISTRTYRDRLDTIQAVADAGIQVCCGGIVGMGETDRDRIELLHTLANITPQPQSVPINALVPVEGTPLADQAIVDPIVLVRMVATARIIMPRTVVRLSAGRTAMSTAEQALCFMAGANSIFTGEKLLTTANPGNSADALMFEQLGLSAWESLPHLPQEKLPV